MSEAEKIAAGGMGDDQRHAVAKAAAEAWFRRSVSDQYMLTSCTGSQAFYDIADAVYAILQRFPPASTSDTPATTPHPTC